MTRPMQPFMTDERLDRLVRELLTERAEDVAASAVSAEAIVERISNPRRLVAARAWVLLAAAAMLTALLIGGALAVGGAIHLPSLLLPAPLPSPALESQSLAPAPSAAAPESERVHGWPDTTENEAGLYSWDGDPCGMSCTSGFMHNGYGSGNVEIRIEVLREDSAADDGGDALTIAGHDAIHRRIDDRQEVWIVDIRGTTIAIYLTTEPGTSAANLTEAYAIIDSMRTEPQDNDLGFRLVFRLTTDDWDSG